MGTGDQLRMALTYADAWGAASRELAFRRIVELLVRGRGTDDLDLRTRAIATLERLRHEVPRAIRREAALLAAETWPDASMLWLFRHEAPEDVAELFRNARLTGAQRNALAPDLAPALHAFLVQDGEGEGGAPAPETHLVSLVGDWRWECDAHARFQFIDGDTPGELLGSSLFDFDSAEKIWPAFRRRVPFRNIEVSSDRGGPFRLAGVPFFDRRSGSFLGYRGTAHHMAAGLLSAAVPAEKLVLMAHEVRSPLNAIMGFAQLIQFKAVDPADAGHREHAEAILVNSARLLEAIDDLTDTARLEQGQWAMEPLAVDAAALLESVAEQCRPQAEERGAALAVTLAPRLPSLLTDERSTHRALVRLVALALSATGAGETLLLGAQQAGEQVCLYLTRPFALDGRSPEQLFDALPASHTSEAATAPLLGIGFGLRLVRRLVEAMGGAFDIERHRFLLTLPAAATEQAVAIREQNA